MAKWEYKVENYDDIANPTELEEILNEYGDQGYELVNINTQYKGDSNHESQFEKFVIETNILVFKRQAE